MSNADKMGQNYFDRMAKLAIPENVDVEDIRDVLEDRIKSILKEVERDCRHKAVSFIHELANKVHNMKLD